MTTNGVVRLRRILSGGLYAGPSVQLCYSGTSAEAGWLGRTASGSGARRPGLDTAPAEARVLEEMLVDR